MLLIHQMKGLHFGCVRSVRQFLNAPPPTQQSKIEYFMQTLKFALILHLKVEKACG